VHKMLNTNKPTKQPKIKTTKTTAASKAQQRYYQMDLFSDSSYDLQASTHDQELQYELKGMFSTGKQPKHYED